MRSHAILACECQSGRGEVEEFRREVLGSDLAFGVCTAPAASHSADRKVPAQKKHVPEIRWRAVSHDFLRNAFEIFPVVQDLGPDIAAFGCCFGVDFLSKLFSRPNGRRDTL